MWFGGQIINTHADQSPSDFMGIYHQTSGVTLVLFAGHILIERYIFSKVMDKKSQRLRNSIC